jgi:hypothetical protein
VAALLNWGRATWTALADGDRRQLLRLALQALPMGQALAAGTGAPEITEDAATIEKLLAGDASVLPASVLSLEALFGQGGTNAACYGPTVLYDTHEDGVGGPSGQLPSGDVGLWLATDSDGRPCAVAQMSKRTRGVKQQTLQALLMAAMMRRTVAASSTLALPTAGASTDLTSDFATRLAAALPSSGVTVDAASIALDSAGQYTYRIVLSKGSGATAKRGEVILRHTPGASASAYSGVLQVAGFTLGNDAAFGCTDQVDSGTGMFKVARISTVKYTRSATTVDFGARTAHYCGHPVAGTGSDDAAQVASIGSDHQLDPSAKITGTARGATLGWRGDFTRYAGSYDKDSGGGNFLMAWQAGTGDGATRSMAAHASVNAGGDRTVDGWFAYGGEVASTTGALAGMICNWAGPGNSHATNTRFQSQTATRASGSSSWVLGSSLITYAPTVSCSSTTTQFDADGNGVLAAGEGLGTAATLDAPSGARTTVQDEITHRGYTQPSLF